MSAKTDSAEDLTLDTLLAAPLFLALHTGDPGEAGTANELPGTNGYARQAINYPDADNNPRTHDATVRFDGPSADEPQVTHWSLKTAVSGGETRYKAALDAPITQLSGVPLEFPAGSLPVSED
jgi:hypothetical protein